MSGMLGVFIGGVLALLGSWLGPWFSERRKEAAKRRRRRIQKYEELVSAIFEFDSWIDMLRRNQASGVNFPIAGVSPFAKVLAIADVYFPECAEQVQALNLAAEKYKSWIVKAHVALSAGGALPQLTSPEFVEAVKPYNAARDRLLNDLRRNAESLR
jgi:hypothetical protein